MSTCVLMCHLSGSVIFFGGQMATTIGEDMTVGLVMKSTCVYMCHMSSSVIFFGGQMDTSVGSIGGDHFGKAGHTVRQTLKRLVGQMGVREVGWSGW